jgi:hypothetical protein
MAGVRRVALGILDDIAILLLARFPFGPRSAEALGRQPAARGDDVLADALVRIAAGHRGLAGVRNWLGPQRSRANEGQEHNEPSSVPHVENSFSGLSRLFETKRWL